MGMHTWGWGRACALMRVGMTSVGMMCTWVMEHGRLRRLNYGG